MGRHEIFTRADDGEILHRDAPLAARSWNQAERTFECTFSTGADVDRGAYVERLDLNQDWSGFVGSPVLNSHNRGDLSNVLGSVVSARTAGTEARAVIRMSARADVEPVVQDVLAGHIRGVSVGYRVSEWRDTTEAGRRVRTATKWTPVELSLVAVPADSGATIRGDVMPTGTMPLADRAAANTEIRSVARIAGLPQTWTDAQIDAGATVDQARAAAFEALQARLAATSQIRTAQAWGFSSDDPEWRTRTIGEAIFARMTGAQPSEAARAFAGLSMIELARDALRARGLSDRGSPGQVLERALGGMMSTSDFPAILGDSVNRTMRQAYTSAPSGLRRVARQTTARDFRTKHRIQLSSAPTLEKVNEAGEFHSGALADQEETYRIETFGRIVAYTRQAIVNDDLGALADVTRRMGIAAAQFENQFLVDLVEANAHMSDGEDVFSAAHGNLAGTGAAPSDTTLAAVRLAMRSQTEPGGQLIDATPRFVIVPAALETATEKVLSAIQAAQVDNVNPWSFLSLVVEPRLSDAKKWYVVADPAVIDGLEFAYLEGEPGPQITSEVGFDVDGMRFKIRLDFGGAFVEPRGWFCNPGQ